VQKAMAMSMNQNMSDQELGVIDPEGTHFRPANNDAYYDNSKWAMTSTRSYAQEILQNPAPKHRQRQPGVPAFLKPSLAGHYIPPLITILHAIPMAREALLAREYSLPDYGYSDEWWDGQIITAPEVINIDQPTRTYYEQEEEKIIPEFQRHMAFLDLTERAYGNAEIISRMAGLSHRSTNEIENELLQRWTESAQIIIDDRRLVCIFRNVASVERALKPFYALDLPLEEGLVDCGMTLYDALDKALWTGYRPSDTAEVFLENVADVLVISTYRQRTKGSGLGIKIPAVWYADRYLKEKIDDNREMQKDKESVREQIRKIDATLFKLKNIPNPKDPSKMIDSKKFLSVAKSHFQSPQTNGAGGASPSSDLSIGNDGSNLQKINIAEELQALTDRIEQKLIALEESKTQALNKLREISALYTKPSSDPSESPRHKYTLRGLSTSPNTTYILANSSGPDDLLSTDVPEYQWWKIQFSQGDVHPISSTKVREIEVLKAAKDESTRALLVYASERAVNFGSLELAPALAEFVRIDNAAFQKELEEPPSISIRQPTPTKRKADGSLDDSRRADEPNWGGWNVAGVNNEFPPPPKTAQPPPYDSVVKPNPLYPTRRAPPQPPSKSYDESIPISLQNSMATTIDPKDIAYEDVDLLGDISEEPVPEMQQRGAGVLGSLGVVPGGTGVGVGQYALGSYEPDIKMSDLGEETEDEAEYVKHKD
jgi:hypothetical protein